MTADFFASFRNFVDKTPESIALQVLTPSGREEFSYSRTAEEVSRVAAFLRDHGIGPGSRVGILMENHPRWGIAFLAVQSAGAVVVPFDILHSPETLSKLIQHAECRFLISSAKLLDLIEMIQSLLPARLPALILGPNEGRYPEWDEVLTTLPSEPLRLPLVERSQDEPLLILYTSGTTGDPKGVILSGRNIQKNTVELLELIQVFPDDHILSVLPLYHVLALTMNFILPLYCGARVTYLNALDPQRIMNTFREEGVSLFVCVPQFFYMVHRRIMQEVEHLPWAGRFLFRRLLSLSSLLNRHVGVNVGRFLFRKVHEPFGPRLRIFGVGGARFDIQVAESFRDLGFLILQAYGMTETAAVLTVTRADAASVGSVGKPLPSTEIRIDQPDERGVGEVLARGESVMSGYLKNESATAEMIDSAGWLHTGDLGYISPSGNLYITGRKKDVIVLSSGKNIYPEEIEHFYQSKCSFIKELCVVGIADPTSAEAGQERLHAVIVPDWDYAKSQQVANVNDMIRYMFETLSQQLPPYKRVHSFEIRREALPRTTTRKLKRFEIQQTLGQVSGTPQEKAVSSYQAKDQTEERVFELIRGIKRDTAVRPEMNLELDLGFDSLQRVELLSNLQQAFAIELPEGEAGELHTVQELTEAVEKRLSGEGASGEQQPKSWSEILREPLTESEQVIVRERLRRRFFVEFVAVCVARSLWILGKLLFRLKAEGKDNIPRQYPFLICPNHLSYLDAFVVVGVLPTRVIRRFFSLAYADYVSGTLVSWLAHLIKTIPVDAERNLRPALRLGAEGLRQDLILIVFPEGERSIDGALKVFRKGPAILATELRTPVLPVGIKGSYEAWPRGSSRIRLCPITIRFGKPLAPLPGESVEGFNTRLFEAVKELV